MISKKDIFDEILAKVIPDQPKMQPVQLKLPWFSPKMQALQDPFRKQKKVVYGPEKKATFPHRLKRRHACACRPSSSSDSCLDGRYLTKVMTSKDVLFPPLDDESIKPTDCEIQSNFTTKQLAEYRDAFDYFDLDCTGFITVDTVSAKLRTLNETAILPEMVELMKAVSSNGDGKINFQQFLCLNARSRRHIDRAKKIRESFQIMDPKLTGYIPANELRFTLINLGEKLTDEQVDLMIPQLDINDDGMVYYEDIVQLICRKEVVEEEGEEEEEASFISDSMFEGRRSVDCPPYRVESASSLKLDFFIKEKEDAALKEAQEQEQKWDTFMDISLMNQRKPKKKVETRDVGV